MNGAASLLSNLVEAGVEVCFANPGTSEMQFVAALDEVSEMKGVLTLFEGVATGAADGYGRVTGKPAAVLLHLGPGLGNGIANLHNARRARTPVVVLVGDHATTHAQYDPPLHSDIAALAGNVSRYVATPQGADDLAEAAHAAVAAAVGPPSGVATLILPADLSWLPVSDSPRTATFRHAATTPSEVVVKDIAVALRKANSPVLFIGGPATAQPAARLAVRCAEAVGARLLSETFPPLTTRGAGTVIVERLNYLGEFAAKQLEGADLIVTVSAHSPATFFAYPDLESDLVPSGASVISFVGAESDIVESLDALAKELGAAKEPNAVFESQRPELPSGDLTSQGFAAAIGTVLEESMIVVDESNTGGMYLASMTQGCLQHEWMTLTGGAIGYGLPAAVGAAIGRPEAQILCLESDGSAMYTIQALWTMAREELNITTVILSNRSYAILTMELARVGAHAPGSAAQSLLDLENPTLDFVALAQGMGVPAHRVTTAEGLVQSLQDSFTVRGPLLIEAVLPKGFG